MDESSSRQRVTIGIVAGEVSGDLLGGHLVSALKVYLPEAEFIGVAGPKMQAAGVRSLFPMERLAVRGYVEVLRHYMGIVALRRQLRDYFLVNPPSVFIGVDAPDFNLELETALKRRRVPTIHYVSPSIWAWRGSRIEKIRRAVSEVLALFPFEKPLYEQAGIPVSYVGHPLADLLPDEPDRAAMRAQMRLPPQARIVALLPGSRQSELQYMADLFVQTAKQIDEALPGTLFLVPLISRETRNLFEGALYRHRAAELPITILFGHAHDALVAADVALVASGTATLEAALLKRPMVITYRMNPVSWAFIRRMKYQSYVGLPNILAGKFVVPEFIQDDATPERLSQALVNLMGDEVIRERLHVRFLAIHAELRQNTAEKAARAILPYILGEAAA
ncbi:MAG: lipid-A-disaccharide synthase [Betaproteobacteria bacterium]|nr:lipid-A-disaccharide synthase [Betaproteobacteria bacterium]